MKGKVLQPAKKNPAASAGRSETNAARSEAKVAGQRLKTGNRCRKIGKYRKKKKIG
jgi:hypothetical protein